MKRCSTSLIIQACKSKPNEVSPYISQIKYWQGSGEKGSLVHCWWDCKLV